MLTWYCLGAGLGRIEAAESYPTLDLAIADMNKINWDAPVRTS